MISQYFPLLGMNASDICKLVFETFHEVGLTVNLKNCDFGKNEVKYLGHIIGSGRGLFLPVYLGVT